MKTVRILVTGSRDWTDRHKVEQELHDYASDRWREGANSFVIVHGACPTGADLYAAEWARRSQHVTPEPHPAEWNKHGKAAGFVRNKTMIDLGADILFAFIRNDSRGATHTLNLAIEAGMPLAVYREYSPDYQQHRELDLT